MIDLWPEEDSLSSKLGSVFDEATPPCQTYEQIRNQLLDTARALRAQQRPVPEALERLERNWALQALAEQVLHGTVSECAAGWLRDGGLSASSLPEPFVEHWRACATCQGG